MCKQPSSAVTETFAEVSCPARVQFVTHRRQCAQVGSAISSWGGNANQCGCASRVYLSTAELIFSIPAKSLSSRPAYVNIYTYIVTWTLARFAHIHLRACACRMLASSISCIIATTPVSHKHAFSAPSSVLVVSSAFLGRIDVHERCYLHGLPEREGGVWQWPRRLVFFMYYSRALPHCWTQTFRTHLFCIRYSSGRSG